MRQAHVRRGCVKHGVCEAGNSAARAAGKKPFFGFLLFFVVAALVLYVAGLVLEAEVYPVLCELSNEDDPDQQKLAWAYGKSSQAMTTLFAGLIAVFVAMVLGSVAIGQLGWLNK